MKLTFKFGLSITFIASVAGTFSFVRAQQEPTTEQIFAKMVSTYAECKSYNATGDVSGTIKTSVPMLPSASGRRTSAIELKGHFTTAFVRADRFRFEFIGTMTEPNSSVMIGREIQHVIWRMGTDIDTWDYNRAGSKKMESFAEAVARASGIPGAARDTIPLLLPGKPGDRRSTYLSGASVKSLADMKELKRGEDNKIGESNCFTITGKFIIESAAKNPTRAKQKHNDSTQLWIDKKTFLIRKVIHNVRTENIPTLTTERTVTTATMEGTTITTFEPVINGEISDKALEFNPPTPNRSLSN